MGNTNPQRIGWNCFECGAKKGRKAVGWRPGRIKVFPPFFSKTKSCQLMVGAPSAPPNSHWGTNARAVLCCCSLFLSHSPPVPSIGLLPFFRVHPSYSAPNSHLLSLYKVSLHLKTDQHWQSTRHRVQFLVS
jgi:hypothetical protein